MGKTLTEKLIAAHLVSGSMEPGAEVALRIDQTLTQDATGTMAYLEFARRPPVWGTTTLLTFLMMLALAATSACSAGQPSARAARAAA